jgi:hypothetical protein
MVWTKTSTVWTWFELASIRKLHLYFLPPYISR